jgi:hypothetical protein
VATQQIQALLVLLAAQVFKSQRLQHQQEQEQTAVIMLAAVVVQAITH